MKKFLLFAALAMIFAVSCSNNPSRITPPSENDSDPWAEEPDSKNDGDTETPDDSNTGDTDTETPDDSNTVDTDTETPDGSNTGDTDTETPDDIDPTDTGLPYCNETSGEDSQGNPDDGSENSGETVDLDYESGFIDLEENSYTLDNRSNTSGKAKMWYYFQPADKNPQTKPLFILYNGGPGSSSSLIFLYNTSKKTADQSVAGEGIAENVYNWNQLGNLLYIDARQTGFSYGIVDNPANSSARSKYFSTANFNVFVDAADFIRVILRFLGNHPAIKSNPVILAGESYGGTRTTAVINILLNVADYAGNNRTFYDAALFDEIAQHFQEIDPAVTGMPSKEKVAKQFRGQIMIQPLAMGQKQLDAVGEVLEQSDSPLYEIQEETGRQFRTCGNSWNCDKHSNALNYVQNANRDIYAYRHEYNWLFDYTDYGIAKILQFSMFKESIMNDPAKIEDLYAANRTGAFRYKNANGYSRNIADLDEFKNLPESVKIIMKARIEQRNAHPLASGNLESVFGTLPSYDEYYVDTNNTINSTFYNASTSPYSDINGEMFLENIRTVKTFITNAEEDIILYARATPEAVKKFSSVSSVDMEDNSFTVNFSDCRAKITFPFYPESSHSVSVNQPAKFFNDVKNWMN